MPVFWRMRLDLVFLVGRSTSGGVFLGVCGLIMILGSLSANGCGCVPVFLVVWTLLPQSFYLKETLKEPVQPVSVSSAGNSLQLEG